MKFAFLIMGDFDHRQDRSSIHQGMAQMIGVASIEEACEVARGLVAEGVDCIELCGAFGEEVLEGPGGCKQNCAGGITGSIIRPGNSELSGML